MNREEVVVVGGQNRENRVKGKTLRKQWKGEIRWREKTGGEKGRNYGGSRKGTGRREEWETGEG